MKHIDEITNHQSTGKPSMADKLVAFFAVAKLIYLPLTLLLLILSAALHAQDKAKKEILDSAGAVTTTTTIIDTSASGKVTKKTREYNPGKAALRSAIFPGLGQIYNKKYWKLPIVYGGLGASGAVFFYNLKNYKNTRFAYRVRYNMRVNRTDSALFVKIKPTELQAFSEESLRFYRDQFRRDIDYSVLVFVLLWGLNVVDAAVDAHLKAFDVSPDLSLQFKPGYSEMAGTNGVSLVLNIGKRKTALLPSRF
ncbi:MAG: DUF5683 domain-containing protein [Chitinophagaceae bacterium]